MLQRVFSVVAAAAIVVPCLSTLVSDHGEPLINSDFLELVVLNKLLLIIHLGYSSRFSQSEGHSDGDSA